MKANAVLLKFCRRFLWVALQLETLSTDCTTSTEVYRTLGHFSRGLNELYWRCITRPSAVESRYTASILHWVCTTPEPLHIDHIRELAAFREDERSFHPANMPSRAAVLRAATNLIALEKTSDSEEDRVMVPVHPTVRDFVFSPLALDTLALLTGTADVEHYKRHDTTLETSLTTLGELCVIYLLEYSARELQPVRTSCKR